MDGISALWLQFQWHHLRNTLRVLAPDFGNCIYLDSGKDEADMTLQRLEGREWVDVIEDGEVVKSPVKIDKLPPGKYRLV